MASKFNPFTGEIDYVNNGDVVGPASSTDNAVVRWDGTAGKLVQDSSVTISDTGSLGVGALTNTLSPVAVFNTSSNKPVLVGTSSNAGLMMGYDGSDIQGRSGTNFATNSALTINRYGGNVGIGTSTPPSYKLDVVGADTGALGFRVKNSTNGVNAQIQNLVENSAGNLGYFGLTSPSYNAFAPINGGRAFIGSYQVPLSFFTQSGSAMYWYIGTTQRMSLSSTGGVMALSPTLNAATGDQYAFRLDYTVNKATSGNDYGFYLDMTDTASPGTSSLISLNVGGANKFNVSSAGVISTNGTAGVSGSFTTADAKTVTVTNGIITSIV